MSVVSGAYAFEDSPTVNGLGVLLNGGGSGTVSTGTFAARPAASISGNLYVDTTNNYIWRDTGVAWVQLSPGTILQTVTGKILRTTGSTVITTSPALAPTITDGFQIWSQAFTPISSTSKIVISFNLMVSSATAARIVVASVFAGSTNVGVMATTLASANSPYMMPFTYTHVPGSAAPITFTCRVGATAAATISVQQYSGATNNFGSRAQADYIIEEIV